MGRELGYELADPDFGARAKLAVTFGKLKTSKKLLPDPNRASSQISAARIAAQAIKMTQPSKKWSRPSACAVPHRSTSTPTIPIRRLFITMVIGILDRNTRARCQSGA